MIKKYLIFAAVQAVKINKSPSNVGLLQTSSEALSDLEQEISPFFNSLSQKFRPETHLGQMDPEYDRNYSYSGTFFDITFGLTFIVIAMSILWINESRQIALYKLLEQAKSCITESNVEEVTECNNFKLV